MNANVVGAIFRRNFLSYFSNPTGYVFICVFVLMSSLAAFWPNDFFNANLANLDQLNKVLPYILLVFVPAITMSIWADEKRQGTDELLLTIPAADLDVVLGKYLAAVGIYTVSLLFSAFCNFWVLWVLSDCTMDLGLFAGTYVGYWWVGLAMVAIGMAASFLTGNLTVSFVLGAIFNAPLAFASSADAIALPGWAVKDWPGLLHGIKQLSLAEQFHDFARGVVTFASIAYFLSLAAVMLYLSMVLIGRRHWSGGRDGQSLGWHYLIRFAALLATVACINVFLSRRDSLRIDVTSEKLSSLSKDTRKLLTNLNSKYPVQVEAYISGTVPETYVPTRLNLLAMLSEFKALGGDKLDVTVHDNMEPFSADAKRAEEQFGIRPQPVAAKNRGVRGSEEIFMGVAVTCGLEKVVVPFFDRGIPVEYELIRSIATACQEKRKKVGVLMTDAKLYGSFDMSSMSQTQNELIVDELQKQYEVVQVDPTNPIKEQYDVLLAVQPSSLGPAQMENFIAAVAAGQPTAVFEDPFPRLAGEVPGTNAPKQPPGGMNMMMMMGRQPPQPKGDINKLWQLLGVDFQSKDVVWQDFNPYPKGNSFITREWIFIDPAAGNLNALSEKNPITAGMRQVLLLYAGSMAGVNNSPMTFSALLTTGEATGVVPVDKVVQRSPMGARLNPDIRQSEKPTNNKYHVAAYIHGPLPGRNLPMSDKAADGDAADGDGGKTPADDKTTADDSPTTDEAMEGEEPATGDGAKEPQPADAASPSATKPAGKPAKPPAKATEGKDKKATEPAKPKEVKVVLVSDIDCLYSALFVVRARGADDEEDDINWKMENVTFVLNVLDELAGDDRFIGIRKRVPVHKTLQAVNAATEKARVQADEARATFQKDFEKTKQEAQEKFDHQVKEVTDRRGNSFDALTEIAMIKQTAEKKMTTDVEKAKMRMDRELKQIDHTKSLEIRAVQDGYKLWSVILPPIPPLVLAFFVFFNRRAQEREGVSKSRLRG